MTGTMQANFNLLFNKDEEKVVSVAYGYKILIGLINGKLDLDEARSILRKPVYYGMLHERPFYWNTEVCPYKFVAEAGGYEWTINFESGEIHMYHGSKEVWEAPIYFQLVALDALLELRIIDNLIGV